MDQVPADTGKDLENSQVGVESFPYNQIPVRIGIVDQAGVVYLT
jgi:hypothetical protein